MAQHKFTARWLESLKPGEGQVDWFDTETRGLGVRVSPGGRVAWFCRYAVNGKQRRETFGTFPEIGLKDARQMAVEKRGLAQKGVDSVVEKRAAKARAEVEAARLTFKGLADLYIERWAMVKKRSWAEDKRILDTYFADWQKRPAEDIARREVNERLHAIASRNGPYQANRCLAVVRKMYNWALATDTGGIENNPAHKLPAPGAEVERERVYTDAEIHALWQAFDVRGIHGAALKAILVTAQRPNEVCGMRWDEVDLEAHQWTIPGDRTKNKKTHIVPLSDLAMDIVRDQQGLDDALVFPSPTRRNTHVRASSKASEAIKNLSGVANFRAHDLRRTASTGMTKLGHTRFIVDRVLNHTEVGVGRVYDRHDYLAEKTAALESWGLKLRQLLGIGGNVVVMERG